MCAVEPSLSGKYLATLVLVGSALLLGILWAATIFQVNAERARTIDAAVTANQNRAIALQQYTTRTLDTADIAAMHFAERFGREQWSPAPGGPPRRLLDPVAENTLFTEVLIADERGDVRFAKRHARPMSVASRAPFRRFREGQAGQTFISSPWLASEWGRAVIAFSRAMHHPGGDFGGMVTILIPVERMTDFNEGAALRPLDMISVIRLDGRTLARRSGTQISYGENLAGKLVMRRQYAEPNGTYLGPSALDGINRYFSHRRLTRYPVFATVGLGEADVLADVHQRTRWYWLGSGALTLAIVAFGCSTAYGIMRRERTMREVAEANTRLRKAQRIGKIGDWEYDVAARKIRWSEQLCAMYGRDPAECVLTLEESLTYLKGHYADGLLRELAVAVRDGDPQRHEIVVEQADGSLSHRRLIISPVKDADGVVVKVLGTEQDISVEKANEHLRDQVAHMARVESMNTMAETIAHELAQPLTAASNFIAAARLRVSRDIPGDPEHLAYELDQIDRQVRLTKTIIRRARDMVSNKLDGPARASVSAIVDDAVALVKVANDCSRIEFAMHIGTGVDEVAADKVQIQQVVMNLVRNACEAASVAVRPRVSISATRRDADTVVISVSDNGPGIAEGIGDIFSPFASSKRGGLGLGLSISRAILQSYGGTIWVDRDAGRGATICFALPAVKADAA